MNHNDRFEIIADLYYRDTGLVSPGKSKPLDCPHKVPVKVVENWASGSMIFPIDEYTMKIIRAILTEWLDMKKQVL